MPYATGQYKQLFRTPSRSNQPAGRQRPHRQLVMVVLAALLAAAVSTPTTLAQSASPVTTDPPLVAIHYEDLLSGEPAMIDLFVPPPLLTWQEFTYSAEDCLTAQGVHEGAPGKVLIVRFEVLTVGTCSTRVDLLFGNGNSSWAASAVVVVNRLPALKELEDLSPWYRLDRIHLPGGGPSSEPAVLMLMGLTNSYSEPLALLGFGNDEGFARAVGRVFRYDPATFFGRYEDLVRNGSVFEPTTLAPGETANFALILDPQRSMPSGSGTLTARPVVLLELAGQRHTLQFPRMSTAWGVELP